MEDPLRPLDTAHPVTPKRRRLAANKRANVKIEEVCTQLRVLALEKGAGAQLPTIRELRSLLNTSSTTLTEAMDLLEAERILTRKERQGIFVADAINKRSIHLIFNIAPLLNVATSPFWSLLWGNLIQKAEERSLFQNEQCTFHFINRPGETTLPDEYVTMLNRQAVDGCLVINLNTRDEEHRSLLHIPHVVFAGGGDWMVQPDVQKSGQLAAQALSDQGCKKVAYWAPAFFALNSERNKEISQFQQTLIKNHLPSHPEFFRYSQVAPYQRPLTIQQQGYLLAKQVFSSSAQQKPDGIYICDDLLTDGALSAFDELGLRVGSDVKIVSHAIANSSVLFGKTKQMTILEHSAAETTDAMFAVLDQLMSGNQPREQITLIPPQLREGPAYLSSEGRR